MGQNRLQYAAMLFFVTGFVLAGSGWSLVISAKMQSRPDWSVCGQNMCSCLPSASIEPYCLLCVLDDNDNLDDSDDTSCASTDSSPTDTPKRVPKNDRFEVVSTASQAGCASIFLSFVFGTRQSNAISHSASASHTITQDNVPVDPAYDIPTPPPRA